MIRERRVAEELMMEIRRFVPRESDCYTLLCDFYQKCYGVEIPRYQYDSVRQEKPPDKVWKDWRRIDQAEARPGDVVIMYPDHLHLGIVLDEGQFLHTSCVMVPPCIIGRLSDIPAGRIEFARYKCFDNHTDRTRHL